MQSTVKITKGVTELNAIFAFSITPYFIFYFPVTLIRLPVLLLEYTFP